MKLSSSIVPSFALQLFLVDLVLAHTLQFFSIMIPTQAGLRNLFPRDTSDPGFTPSAFISVPTQTGLPNSPPGEDTADSGCFIVCPEPSSSTSPPATATKLAKAWPNFFLADSDFDNHFGVNLKCIASSQLIGLVAYRLTFPRTQGTVIIGLITVGLALLGGLAAVLFLLHRWSLSKHHNFTTFPLDAEAALSPPSPSQKGGSVGYAHPASAATAQPTSESDLARKVAELEAWMQEELAALGRGQNHSEVESATTTTGHAVNHGRRAKLDILAAHRVRENTVDRLPSYRQFDSGSV
ncbi:hypothetical protein C8R46DRAFT_1189637 [Mycena filopes]|nr:hypothetical protein C8R46DRAFT_1189637 [Mycena filopes]